MKCSIRGKQQVLSLWGPFLISMDAASFSPTIVLKLKPKSTIAKPGPRTGIVKRRLLAEIFPIGLGASHRVESIISDSGSASLPSHLNL